MGKEGARRLHRRTPGMSHGPFFWLPGEGALRSSGSGTCAGACPNKAITLAGYNDREIIAEIIGALAG